jgi:hypothetical protein
MKSIKSISRIGIIMFFVTACSSTVIAQKVHLLVSYSPIIPISFMSDAKIGLASGFIGVNIDFTKKVSWTTTLGYNRFGTKTISYFGPEEYECTLTFIPVLTGVQFYFKDEGTRMFCLLKAGYFIPSNDLVKGDVGFTPGLGIQIPSKTGKSKFDISVVYNGVLGAKTIEFQEGSSSLTMTFHYLSYLAVNFGFVF